MKLQDKFMTKWKEWKEDELHSLALGIWNYGGMGRFFRIEIAGRLLR